MARDGGLTGRRGVTRETDSRPPQKRGKKAHVNKPQQSLRILLERMLKLSKETPIRFTYSLNITFIEDRRTESTGTTCVREPRHCGNVSES
ncbi:hypothetical protein OUZ56_004302 [Daphnia magna]|uniref:Uncharacterized protein n=1 Tax=Daphnia magna TaxID=35525 RepID=A0ABQ9YPD3_9CRUS|nr:hypothetical protein OUZ56_004302 [Daphnia magna]